MYLMKGESEISELLLSVTFVVGVVCASENKMKEMQLLKCKEVKIYLATI